MEVLKKIIKKIREGYLSEMYVEAKWIYQYAKKYWKSICFYIAAGIFGTVMGLGGSVVSKYILDAVTNRSTGRLGLLAAVMVGMALGNIAANAVISRISARISVVIQNEIQAELFEKIIYTDWESLHPYRSGDLLNRLTSDASQVSASVIGWLPTVFTRLVQFIGAFGIILYYDPIMAMIALIGAPVTLCMSSVLVKKMRRYNREMRAMTSDLMSFQNDSFQNLQTVKAFGLMDFFVERLTDMQKQYKDKMMEYNKFSVYTSSFLSLTGMLVSYICFGWSAYRLWNGYITVGTMMMFLQMANSLSSAFSALVQTVPSAINAATCAGRLMSVTELEKEQVLDEASVQKLWKQRSDGIALQLTQVDVTYREGNQVVENGNFCAESGEITVIIGPSGEGKTSLIRLMLGLIYPVKGKARLLGKNGKECPISSATRGFFSYVPQGNTIFAGTIAENMRMVKCDATEEEIIEALRIGCAYDFVERLPEGIHTKIGEHGTGLSEGQAQRIAISRAILRDAPILLLDEATSALDMETEQAVLDNIMACGKKKTCIVTTHRPSVLAMSSRVYEIRENQLLQLEDR
ncbi:MAG: ABC transporter ATP-binding protein [Butyricicoccus sp.]